MRFPSRKQQQLSRRHKTLVFFSTLCFLPMILFCLRQKRRPWKSNRPHTEAASPAAPRLLRPQPYPTTAPLLAPLSKTQRDEKLPFDLSESSFAFWNIVFLHAPQAICQFAVPLQEGDKCLNPHCKSDHHRVAGMEFTASTPTPDLSLFATRTDIWTAEPEACRRLLSSVSQMAALASQHHCPCPLGWMILLGSGLEGNTSA